MGRGEGEGVGFQGWEGEVDGGNRSSGCRKGVGEGQASGVGGVAKCKRESLRLERGAPQRTSLRGKKQRKKRRGGEKGGGSAGATVTLGAKQRVQ